MFSFILCIFYSLTVNLLVLAAGSRFMQNGTFEVTKSDVDPIDLLDSPNAPSHSQSPLQISVPSELEGVVYIQVVIKRLSGRDCRADVNSSHLKLLILITQFS